MWTCPVCGEKVEEQFDSCWRCQAARSSARPDVPPSPNEAVVGGNEPVKWQARYELFRGTLATWDELFGQAAQFATQIGPKRLITISHSEDRHEGVVAVWYWADEKSQGPAGRPGETGETK